MNVSLKPERTASTAQRYQAWRRQVLGVLNGGVGCLAIALVVAEGVVSQPVEPVTPGSATIPATEVLERPTLNRPTLKSGSQGTDVTELQAALKLLGYFNGVVNGVYGPTTVTAVSQFQQAAGLSADGVVGPATWNRLFPPMATVSPAPVTTNRPTPNATTAKPVVPNATTPVPASTATSGSKPNIAAAASPSSANKPDGSAAATSELASFPILRVGMKGPAVTGLQQRLRAIGVFKGAADGVFGPQTQEAVKAAQRKFKLDPDGVVGPATWSELMQ